MGDRAQDAYEKQKAWNEARQHRNERHAMKADAVELEECTFAPVLMSKQRKSSSRRLGSTGGMAVSPKSSFRFDNKASTGPRASLDSHVARHERARKEREAIESGKPSRERDGGARARASVGAATSPHTGLNGFANDAEADAEVNTAPNPPNEDPRTTKGGKARRSSGGSSNSSRKIDTSGLERPPNPPDQGQPEAEQNLKPDAAAAAAAAGSERPAPISTRRMSSSKGFSLVGQTSPVMWQHEYQVARQQSMQSTNGMYESDGSEDVEETFFEQLQRERREWQRERARMQNVIELQQAELQKRSGGVETRAAEIANTFSAGIATFEQRLLKLEEGVQQELHELRTSSSGTDTNARLSKLEGGMKAILEKLSVIAGERAP